MRIHVLRPDFKRVYLSDIENPSQRNYSSEPKAQRYHVLYSSDEAVVASLKSFKLTVIGDNTDQDVDTTSNNVLKIISNKKAYTFSVTAGPAVSKSTIVTDLNMGFNNRNAPFVATLLQNKSVKIDTKDDNCGIGSRLEIESLANGSTLNDVLDSGWGAIPPVIDFMSVDAFKTATSLSTASVDLSLSVFDSMHSFSLLSTQEKEQIRESVLDTLAPKFIETGRVLLSIDRGVIGKLASSSLSINNTIGAAIVLLDDDGVTHYL